MESRIARVLARLKEAGTKALIPYVTPEYPFRGITVPLLSDLADAGADLLEVGMPFSDPLADGPTIQHSSEVGIRNGATIPVIFDAVREFRAGHETPVLLMGYVNLILHYGVDAFLQDAAAAGVDGLILPDLPPEEASEVKEQSERNGLSAVFLIAYAGLAASVVGFTCWNLGVRTIGPKTAGYFGNLFPVFGAALGILLLGEPFRWFHAVGGVVTLSGIYLATIASSTQRPPVTR